MKVFALATIIIFMVYLMAAGTVAEQAPVAALGSETEEAPVKGAANQPKDGDKDEAPASLLVEAIVLGAIISG